MKKKVNRFMVDFKIKVSQKYLNMVSGNVNLN